ncbi:MAG TPA: hypothetical protein VFP05_18825 [Thermomicrobiales bacterium]|nr:hypothetical protein [Thermomicrobiales bacterium]
MDPQRFDSIAKRLGTRLSRRSAIRASAGAALGAVALSKLAPTLAQDDDTGVKDRFISIRTYSYTGPIEAAQSGLKDLVVLMEQQAGFISIDFVDGDDAIYVIATFLDKSTAVAAAKEEDAWIEEHAQAILSGKPEIHSGDVFLRSELHAGCACTAGVEDACNSSRLTCCATTAEAGGPGVCLTTATTCPAVAGAEPTATSVPVEEPTAVPTDVPACTGEGCDCIAGTEGACDDGLCCVGADTPGGTGTCSSDCGVESCTSEGCACTAGTDGACDAGLCCVGADTPGGTGTCSSDCGEPPCTSEGCACTAGTDGACDAGLCCGGADTPGGTGTCTSDCGDGGCTGADCPCTEGTEGACDGDLVCCGADVPGGEGTCQAACG